MRAVAAVAVFVAACLSGGCSAEEEKPEPEPLPQPNGVAEMTVRRAFAAAERAMGGLPDATYVGSSHRVGSFVGIVRLTTIYDGRGRCQTTYRLEPSGTAMERQIGGDVFIHYDEAAMLEVLDAKAELADRLQGQWLRIPGDPPADRCDLGALVPGERWQKQFQDSGVVRLGEREARRFDGRDDEGPVTLWIATTGEPLVLRIRRQQEDDYDVSLTETDSGVALEEPDPVFKAPFRVADDGHIESRR